MTDLSLLKVSLTKHGAHKIAFLLKRYPADKVLSHVKNNDLGIDIDFAQAGKILSIVNGDVPPIWEEIRKFGEQDIFDLVFIANIFSHYKLIQAMRVGVDNGCKIENEKVLSGKAYTNFAHTIEEFKYKIEHTPNYITFDISRIFYKDYLIEPIIEIIKMKLCEALWDQKNDFLDECIQDQFHKVFGLSEDDFRQWLKTVGENNETFHERLASKVKAPRNFDDGINFAPGHNEKYEGEINVKMTSMHKVTFTHNHIQTAVYDLLKKQYPADKIGTEIPTNTGSVDLVRKNSDGYFLYEIKTNNDTRKNIRQALSQLLEYAYWNKIHKVQELIIVAPSAPTEESKSYIQKLRDDFLLPVSYIYFNLKTDKIE